MKRWQIEQILYLNDIGKTKLVLPETHHFGQTVRRGGLFRDRENIMLSLLRTWFTFMLKIL